MPWRLGSKTGKGWQILKKTGSNWKVVGHSKTKKNARASIRARRASESK